jgi:hypothetical protein
MREQIRAHALARETERVPVAARAGVETIDDVGHPELAALLVVVDQPHRAGVTVALIDHRLRQGAEKALDVGLAHQQIERELDDVGLHLCEALGPPAFARLARQRRAEHLRIALVRVHDARLFILVA